MRIRDAVIWSAQHVMLGGLAVVLLAAPQLGNVGDEGAIQSSEQGTSLETDREHAIADSFRVQVYAVTERQVAESVRSKVRQWWTGVEGGAPSGVFGAPPALTIEHAEPYYRVHVGSFSRRAEARQALSFIRQEYPDAFIVERDSAPEAMTEPAQETSEDEPTEEQPSEEEPSDDESAPPTPDEQPQNDPYRVQLFAVVDREAAEGARSTAQTWWSEVEERAPEAVFGSDPPLILEQDGAHYQLLMGRFATENQAHQARSFLSQRYPDAFIVRTEAGSERMQAEGTDSMAVGDVATAGDEPTFDQKPPPDNTDLSPSTVWAHVQKAAEVVDGLHRDSVYTKDRVADIFDLGCSPPRPEEARANALAQEATHENRNIGVDLEARYGQQSAPGTNDFAGSLSGTYVGLDWNVLSSGFLGNRQRGSLLETRAEAARLTGRLAQIQRTETCRARRVQKRLRGMIPALLEAKIELGMYRERLLRQAYLEGEALLDDYLEAKESVREAQRRLETIRQEVHQGYQAESLEAFPPLLKIDFEALSQAEMGDSLRKELGEVERRALSIEDRATLDTRLSLFGRYTTTRTFENRDFEFGLRFSQPLFGRLMGNDGVAEEERAELRRRQEQVALAEQRENLRTVHRRFEEDEARAIRAHYRTASRRERVRRRLGQRTMEANDRLNEALLDAETLLTAVVEKATAYGEVYEEVARAFSAAREPFTPRPLRIHPVSTYEQRGRVGRRSLYMWSQAFRSHSNTFLLELAEARKIERFIVSAGRNTPMDKLRDLQEQARANDLAVELLLAPNHWVRPGGLERAKTRIENLDLQGSSLHLDVEPHMFEDFDQREDELLRRYLEVLRLARRTIGDQELVVSIPLFWPERVYQEIATIADRVHLMAYGEEETHERASRVLDVARHFEPEQRVVALRPEDFANPWEVDQSISTLQKVVGADRFALHDLESFLEFIRTQP